MLDCNDEFRYNLLTFIKLRCLELAEEDRSKGEDRLAVARRYFEWVMQGENS